MNIKLYISNTYLVRGENLNSRINSIEQGVIYAVGDVQVDTQRQIVTVSGEKLELPMLSFRLLVALLKHSPNTVTKDQLIEEVWKGLAVSDDTLTQRVKLLRQSLGSDWAKGKILLTIRGEGYRIDADIVRLQAEEQLRSESIIPKSTFSKFTAPPLTLILCLSLLLIAFWFNQASKPVEMAKIGSLAVLPLDDFSSEHTQDYFAAGVHEEMLVHLSSIDALNVISRTSVKGINPSQLSIPQIGKLLGADAIIEGSIRRLEQKVRISLQLIHASTDTHLWADSYEVELTVDNLFDVQQLIARHVADALTKQVTEPNMIKPATERIAAYDKFLAAKYLTFSLKPENLRQAIESLQQAISIDPQFVDAYVLLGWAYSFSGTNYGDYSPKDVFPKAKDAVLKALSIDGQSRSARNLYADILTWYDWDFAEAQVQYELVLSQDPNDILGYALFLSTQKRHDEAIEAIERRLSTTPDDPYVWANAAWRYLSADRIDKALDAARRAHQHADSSAVLGYALMANGDIDEAIIEFEKDLRLNSQSAYAMSNLAAAYYKAEKTERAGTLQNDLNRLANERYVPPTLLANVAFAKGDADIGFAYLQQALEMRDRDIIFLQVDQMLDGWRQDTRYRQLAEKLGFLVNEE